MEEDHSSDAAPPRTPRVHDPVIAREDGVYYLLSTGRGVSLHTSHDMVAWQKRGPIIEPMPCWTSLAVPGSGAHLWAPDLAFFSGRWHLYYSVSTFGRNGSAIGLATSPTLNPQRQDHAWRDQGLVVSSTSGGNWNAIDPNIVLDEDGRLWLALGSFWSGIKLLPIEVETGKPPSDAALHSIASRPHTPEVLGSIEGAFILPRGGWYYLFASFDFCCRGAASTYNIRVGRAREITGPYVDCAGQAMLEGGGTMLLGGGERWRGPGHNTVFREGNSEWLVYHAYDALDNGVPRLRIEKLGWDSKGWPTLAREAAST